MAGRGPAPKDSARRARRNPDQAAARVVRLERSPQPELPDGFDWPDQTRAWWDKWRANPLSEDFTAADWDFLLDTTRIHAEFWRGDLKQAAELRLRVAKFGMTPEDRARLRIVFADADAKEDRGAPPVSARERYASLRVIDGGKR
ncbi:MAG: hypothetical protein ACRD0P_31565 [Stackebrandtia sp.]